MSDLESAIGIVADASRVAGSVQDRLDQVREITKDDRSPVTVADFAAQAIVAAILAERAMARCRCQLSIIGPKVW